MSDAEKTDVGAEDTSIQPEKAKMPVWKKVFIGIGIFFGLMLIYSFYTLSGVGSSSDAVMDNLQAQDCTAIYEESATVFKSAVTEEDWSTTCLQFSALVVGGSADRTDTSFSAETGETKIGEATYMVTAEDGTEYPVSMQLQDEDGWKLSSISFDPADQ